MDKKEKRIGLGQFMDIARLHAKTVQEILTIIEDTLPENLGNK